MRDGSEGHTLGPHVVGQRIVVRHLLPDGRATDVLGVCTAWGEQSLTLAADSGPIQVELATIVTGKPVPPRASVKSRLAARDVELHTHALWPDLLIEPLGEWALRCAAPTGGRLRRRANSTLAMGDPGVSLPAASAVVMQWYDARDRQPMVMAVADSPIEAELLGLGWRDLGSGSAHCQLASVGRALRACGPTTAHLEVRESMDRAHIDGVARGRATLDGDWVVLDQIEVDPAHRRRGLARGVLAELLDWAASRGALTAMLQVEVDNPGAVALYEGIGFRTHHTYRYLAY